jgi:hypothetical protein
LFFFAGKKKIKARKKNPCYRKILMLLLQQNSPRHLRYGEEEESRCAANPRADDGDGAKTLRATKGRDERRERRSRKGDGRG